jgi:hypothetical protein
MGRPSPCYGRDRVEVLESYRTRTWKDVAWSWFSVSPGFWGWGKDADDDSDYDKKHAAQEVEPLDDDKKHAAQEVEPLDDDDDEDSDDDSQHSEKTFVDRTVSDVSDYEVPTPPASARSNRQNVIDLSRNDADDDSDDDEKPAAQVVELLNDDDVIYLFDLTVSDDSDNDVPTAPASARSNRPIIIDLSTNDCEKVEDTAVSSFKRSGPTDLPVPLSKRQKRSANNSQSQKRAKGRSKARRAEDPNLAGKRAYIEKELVLLRKEKMLCKIKSCPPEYFFKKKTRQGIIDAMPTTREELSSVNGVGTYTVDQHGDAILYIITQANERYAVGSQGGGDRRGGNDGPRWGPPGDCPGYASATPRRAKGNAPTPKMCWTSAETKCLTIYMTAKSRDFLEKTRSPWVQVRNDNEELKRFEPRQIKDKWKEVERKFPASSRMPRNRRKQSA